MTPQSDITKTLQEVHGDGDCHICGKPKAGPGEPICSYPHGMVPIKPVNPDHSDGFWEWSESKMTLQSDTKYKYLGNLAACEPWAAQGMRCDDCMVEWTGCWDNFECPLCGRGELPYTGFCTK